MDLIDRLFDKLWISFCEMNPQSSAIVEMLTKRGERVVNDHVAFRTFNDPRVSIDVLAKPFVESGYAAKGEYQFPQKKLFARHYEHPLPERPKVFISELLLEEMSPQLQSTVQELLSEGEELISKAPELCLLGRPWTVTSQQYTALSEESEYAGWLSAYGYCANHFTVLVNALAHIDSLEELNSLLKEQGFELNSEGGEIKGSPSDFLEQSSTLASMIDVNFADGPMRIPGCYYEFAKRYPMADGTLFSGFVAKSADKIFQSTDRRNAN
ncbi:hypothetical protein KOR42_41120 [Thalassoglobus neptunius]|uniref:2-oxoadipate dioxygenase/decarboxylase n=1 Tax=Thalassoglobus neptunius TaxID=1938619 RepID=A0A5C5WBC8_9PLAN|nr:DUF1338 domain-containing protein [Thalassoglobus neptunius]TWT47914.1 hypothetical protein KOR42_41120 [Thalassoglobus neptunius]